MAASCTSIIARRRPAFRSTRRRPSRSTSRRCRSSTISSIYDQHKPQNSMGTIVPDLATKLGLEQGRPCAHVQAAPGRQVARRPAVHRQGREVHLRPAAGQGAGQVPQKSAQGLVRLRRQRHHQRRLRGRRSISSGRSRRCWRCSRRATRRSIRATSRRRKCARIRSAPARSSSSRSSRTSRSSSTKNPDYWKKGLPYLDGIEYTIITNRATAVLAFVAGKVDMTFPTEMTAALVKDIKIAGPDRDLRDRADQRQHQSHHQSRKPAVQ